MTNPQGTSKAGKMGWENEIWGLIYTLIGLSTDRRSRMARSRQDRFTNALVAIFRKRLDQAIAQERKRIAENIKGITPKMPDELFDMVDEYDDYISGYSEAKLDALNVITNNHE